MPEQAESVWKGQPTEDEWTAAMALLGAILIFSSANVTLNPGIPEFGIVIGSAIVFYLLLFTVEPADRGDADV